MGEHYGLRIEEKVRGEGQEREEIPLYLGVLMAWLLLLLDIFWACQWVRMGVKKNTNSNCHLNRLLILPYLIAARSRACPFPPDRGGDRHHP